MTTCPTSPVEDIDVWTLAERAASGMGVSEAAVREIARALLKIRPLLTIAEQMHIARVVYLERP